jgi:hypothetical protein
MPKNRGFIRGQDMTTTTTTDSDIALKNPAKAGF